MRELSDLVTRATAARMLGVTPPRIGQLAERYDLIGAETADGLRLYSVRKLEALAAKDRPVGRPPAKRRERTRKG